MGWMTPQTTGKKAQRGRRAAPRVGYGAAQRPKAWQVKQHLAACGGAQGAYHSLPRLSASVPARGAAASTAARCSADVRAAAEALPSIWKSRKDRAAGAGEAPRFDGGGSA